MEPGVGYEPYRHIGDEHVLIIEGGCRDEMGENAQGAFVHYDAGTTYTPVATGVQDAPVSAENPACLLLALATGGIELPSR